MQVLRIVLSVLMALFAAVQVNDPDALSWMVVYGAVALALGLAVWRARWLRTVPGRVALALLVAGLAVLLVTHWPREAGFWRREVWQVSESAREGMGLMIAFAASLTALPVAFGAAPRPGATA